MADDMQVEIKRIAEKIAGCYHVSIVGYDGITVTQHIIEVNFEASLYDAEISSIMLASKEVKDNLSLGFERELIWVTDNAIFIIQPIGEDFFIYACLKPTGSNPGMARIELTKAKESIRRIIYPQA